MTHEVNDEFLHNRHSALRAGPKAKERLTVSRTPELSGEQAILLDALRRLGMQIVRQDYGNFAQCCTMNSVQNEMTASMCTSSQGNQPS
jgi:hypothetical protein